GLLAVAGSAGAWLAGVDAGLLAAAGRACDCTGCAGVEAGLFAFAAGTCAWLGWAGVEAGLLAVAGSAGGWFAGGVAGFCAAGWQGRPAGLPGCGGWPTALT